MARTSKTSKNSPKALLKTPAKKPASSATKNASAANHDFPEVRSLIDLLKKNGLAVLEFEKGDFRITLKTPAGASSGSTLIQGHSSHALQGDHLPDGRDLLRLAFPGVTILR